MIIFIKINIYVLLLFFKEKKTMYKKKNKKIKNKINKLNKLKLN
jgi:hypothetical protein